MTKNLILKKWRGWGREWRWGREGVSDFLAGWGTGGGMGVSDFFRTKNQI